MTDAPNTCPTCGATLDVERTGGVCAACLLLGAADEPATSTSLGRLAGYELIEVIARGGMGIVYRARQSDPAREVALKALPGAIVVTDESRQRFRIEAEAMARLEHPAILPIYELGEVDETPFFTMKLAAGGSLAGRVGDYAGKWREIAELIARITDAVQFAHERGVLHRDLKPGNILFDESGQAFVSDFGLAKITGDDTHLTRTLALMGTPSYMAPEMAAKNGGVTTASDVWSLGVILYELLAGHAPFRGVGVAAVLRAVAEDEPEALKGQNSNIERVPRDLAVITFKALKKDPAQRYGSARELADDLRRWLRGEAILAQPTPLLEHVILWARRHPALAGMAAALVMVMAVASGLLIRANRQLSAAVITARINETRAESSLRDSLIAQSGLVRQSMRTGQRFKALELIRQAIATSGPSEALRDEAAAALAEPDVERVGEAFRFQPGGRVMNAVAVTKDFRCALAPLPEDGAVALREIASGKTLWRHENKRTAKPDQFAVSNSAQFAALVYSDHWLEVWDTTKDELRLGTQMVPFPKQDRFRYPVRIFTLHPLLPLAAWVDEAGTVQMQNLDTGELTTLLRDQLKATALNLSTTGTHFHIATGNAVELWKIRPLERVWQAPVNDTSTFLEGFGQTVVTTDRTSREALVITEGKVLTRFMGVEEGAGALAFFAGSHLALSLGSRGQLHAWDTRDARGVWQMNVGTGFVSTNETGDEFIIEQADGQAVRWRRALDRVFRELYSPDNMMGNATRSLFSISADGRLISTLANSSALLWDARNGVQLTSWRLPGGKGVGIVGGFSRDGRTWFASHNASTGIYRRSITESPAGQVQPGDPELIPGTEGAWLSQPTGDGETWLIHGGETIALWKLGSEPVAAEFISSGDVIGAAGRYIMHGSYKAGTNPVREAATGKTVGTFNTTSDGKASLTPDGRWLVLLEAAQYRFIDTTTWQPRAVVPSRIGGSREGAVAISADGTLAAVEQEHDVIDLVTLPEGKLLVKLTPPQSIAQRALQISPDGNRLYVLGTKHRLFQWDLKALREELAALGLGW